MADAPPPKKAPRPNRRAARAKLDADRAAVIDAIDGLSDVGPLAGSVAHALEEGGEFEAILDLAGRLEDARRTVVWMLEEVNKSGIKVAPDRWTSYPVPGGGLWKIFGGKERKRYDNDGLRKELAQRLIEVLRLRAIVTADGEPGEPGPLMYGIVDKVLSFVGATVPSFDGWRSGVARELGIDLKAFSEMEVSPLRARIESRIIEE